MRTYPSRSRQSSVFPAKVWRLRLRLVNTFLPLLGAQMDKLCLLRSMTHKMNVHGPAYSEIMTGGHVKEVPATPADLSATILHPLGIDPRTQYNDHFQLIPRHLSEGTAIKNLG